MNTSIRSIMLVVLLIDLLLVLEPVLNQQQRKKPSRKRKPTRKKGEDTRISCYTCYADFEKIPLTVFNPVNYIYNNLCYNLQQNLTLADHDFLTKCSGTTKYCMVDITRMNGVLLKVDRRCGSATCRKTCLDRGYGVITETCSFCCGRRVNEDDPDYDEDLHSTYRCPEESCTIVYKCLGEMSAPFHHCPMVNCHGNWTMSNLKQFMCPIAE